MTAKPFFFGTMAYNTGFSHMNPNIKTEINMYAKCDLNRLVCTKSYLSVINKILGYDVQTLGGTWFEWINGKFKAAARVAIRMYTPF